jgi:hypothetical protein
VQGSERSWAAIRPVALLLLAGLAIRLIIAYALFPGSGFETDVNSFGSWALTLAKGGPGQFYATAGFADYTPGYLYILWVVGVISGPVSSLTGIDGFTTVINLMKLPSMLVDLGVAYLLYRTVLRWGDRDVRSGMTGQRIERAALVAAALYLFNPVTIYDSALWAQVDAFGALVMLGAVLVLIDGHSEAATGLTVVAGLMKPQYGIVLAPIVAVVLIRRHLVAPGSGPRPTVRFSALRDWLTEEQGPWRLVSSAAVGLVVLLVILVPFNLDVYKLVWLVLSTSGEYHYLSVNAYNGWALLGAPAGAPSIAEAGTWSDDLVPLVGSLPGVVVGTALLVVGFLLGIAHTWLRDGRRAIVLAAVYLSLAFFVLPTRVHERYLFPVFVFLPLLAMTSRRWRIATIVLAVVSFMNLHAILTLPLYGTPNVDNLPLGDLFRTQPFVTAAAIGHMSVFVLAFLAIEPIRLLVARIRGRTTGPEPPELGEEPGLEDEAVPPGDPAGFGPQLDRHGASASTGTAAAGMPVPPSAVGSGMMARRVIDDAARVQPREPRVAPLSLGDRLRSIPIPPGLRAAFALRSIRRDRSPALAGEGGGRLDRLDLFLVVLLVVSALTVRTWRLDEPRDMHFDEVYHARTATEFLQDWRYGIPHDIYEFTHPHLAKYLIAAGLVLFGNDRVTGESQLGSSVVDAAIEPRWSPPEDAARRDGDRLYVATGGDVRVYDLERRGQVATIAVPGASAVAVDPDRHVLFVGTDDGSLWRVDTGVLDDLRSANQEGPDRQADAQQLGDASAGGRVAHLVVASGGSVLVAVTSDGAISSADPESGAVFGRAAAVPVSGIVALDASERLVVDLALVDDRASAAAKIAAALKDEPDRIAALLEGSPRRVALRGFLPSDQSTTLGSDLADVPGVTIESGGTLAVSGEGGVRFLDAETLTELGFEAIEGPVGGLVLTRGGEKPRLYVAAGSSLQAIDVAAAAPPSRASPVAMPGRIDDVRLDEASNILHALGRTPDGSAETIYVVETHGEAVFADARLPFVPATWVIDQQKERPASDRQQIVALAADGSVAVVDAGSHAFAWRLPGVIAGALMAGLLFLLARILFRRRSVAVIVGVTALLDGMFFAQSRIAMNDTYAALFIVAAYTVFAALYLGRWRGWSSLVVGFPLLGLLLGLALASKWVGAYALGGIVLLVLLRSALGRIIALGAMIGLSGILGYVALSHAPEVQAPQTNPLFLLMMVGLTFLLAAAIVVRPVRFTLEELRFAVIAPLVAGAALAFVALLVGDGQAAPAVSLLSRTTILALGFALVVVAGAAYAAVSLGRRFGMGPLAPRPEPGEARALVEPASDPPRLVWLVPGASRGIPWLWVLACLTLVPLAVYLLSYVPWVNLGNQWFQGFPAGHTGQTFLDLQISMYNYHDHLRATHAASSPWWAWPFDLKPVWFHQAGLADDTASSIYDSGNLVLFWLAVPAVAWTAWQAWRRRSLALTLVVLALACQWLPWVRIDRATFQYHVYTSLPFAFLALAYFLAELWHGPDRRTWMLARVAAALAILGPAILWLGKAPLCIVAGTARVAPNSQACGSVAGSLVISERIAASLLILAAGAVAAWWQLGQREQDVGHPAAGDDVEGTGAADDGQPGDSARTGPSSIGDRVRDSWLLVATIAVTVVALVVAQSRFSEAAVITAQLGSVGPLVIAVIVGVLLAVPAWLALVARDPRRFVVGVLVAAGLWFVLFYPNVSALPLPGIIVNAYQGLVPTWIYDFQFAVNLDPPSNTTVLGRESLLLVAMIGIAAVAVMYATWSWRIELAARRASRDDTDQTPSGGSAEGPIRVDVPDEED